MRGSTMPSRLLLLTDRRLLPPGRSLEDTVARCADAGLEAVLLRELDLPREERTDLAGRLAATGVSVVAARTWLRHADGVHLASAQTGLDAREAPYHGRSCHDDEEVRRAVGGGAAYLTISPIARSVSKPGYGPPLGIAGVSRAVRLAGTVPVLALGGVDERNAADLRAAGAHGVAVMGAVMSADDPAGVVTRILEAVG